MTVLETRNLGNEDESETLLLRQENSRLSQTLTDLRQNCSDGLFAQQQSEQSDGVIWNEDRVFCAADKDDGLKSAIRLLEDSIKVYDGFIKNELREAERWLSIPTCYGGDRSYEAYCEVSECVKERIIGPYRERADQLRDNATTILSALNRSLTLHYGFSINSVESIHNNIRK